MVFFGKPPYFVSRKMHIASFYSAELLNTTESCVKETVALAFFHFPGYNLSGLLEVVHVVVVLVRAQL